MNLYQAVESLINKNVWLDNFDHEDTLMTPAEMLEKYKKSRCVAKAIQADAKVNENEILIRDGDYDWKTIYNIIKKNEG